MRDRLLLAYACCEWAGALTHLTALGQVGCRVPDQIRDQVVHELTGFTTLWNTIHGVDQPPLEAAQTALSWLTEHTEELDALLKEVEGSARGQKV